MEDKLLQGVIEECKNLIANGYKFTDVFDEEREIKIDNNKPSKEYHTPLTYTPETYCDIGYTFVFGGNIVPITEYNTEPFLKEHPEIEMEVDRSVTSKKVLNEFNALYTSIILEYIGMRDNVVNLNEFDVKTEWVDYDKDAFVHQKNLILIY
jgi:hypothetical protein